jgi:hypothetical protein
VSKEKGIYLVAKYFMKPQAHVNTSKAGWMDNPENIRWDEQMLVTRGLKPKDNNAQVVLNLSEKSIVRNTFAQGKTFDEVFIYFLNGYSQYLVPVMGQLDREYLETIAAELQTQLPPETMTDEEMKAAQAAQSSNQIIDAEYEEVKAE